MLQTPSGRTRPFDLIERELTRLARNGNLSPARKNESLAAPFCGGLAVSDGTLSASRGARRARGNLSDRGKRKEDSYEAPQNLRRGKDKSTGSGRDKMRLATVFNFILRNY
jgi:hypothetical protein